MNINSTFKFKKVRKMQNLGNIYICGSPSVISRTDAQNGLYSIFNRRKSKSIWSADILACVAALTLAILSMITVFDMWPFNRVWPLKGRLLNEGCLIKKKFPFFIASPKPREPVRRLPTFQLPQSNKAISLKKLFCVLYRVSQKKYPL